MNTTVKETRKFSFVNVNTLETKGLVIQEGRAHKIANFDSLFGTL